MANQLPVPASDSLPATIDGEVTLETDTRRPMRIGLWVLAIGFGGFLLWAALAPLDEGVPTQGMVTIDNKSKAVQHLTGGVVSAVLVQEGEMVRKGQVLVRLDTSENRANYEAIRQHYLGLSAAESRLIAEQTDAPEIHFPAELLHTDDPVVLQQMASQRALFDSRRDALNAEERGIAESISGQESMNDGYKGQLSSSRVQLDSLQAELKGMSDLVREGYAPRNKQMVLERQVADIKGRIDDLQSRLAAGRSSIAELRQRAVQRRQEYHKEGDTELARIRLELQADKDKSEAAAEELARDELRAPVSGQVVGLTVHTDGGVIQPGQTLMHIVPTDASLILESHIPPNLIDRVRTGEDADIRFNAFAHTPALVVQGKLISVSKDLVNSRTPQGGETSYFLARVAVTAKGLKSLGNREMHPGMPAEVIIKTGERSMLNYLIYPLIKRMSTSMKEE